MGRCRQGREFDGDGLGLGLRIAVLNLNPGDFTVSWRRGSREPRDHCREGIRSRRCSTIESPEDDYIWNRSRPDTRRDCGQSRAVIAWIAYKTPEDRSEIPGIYALDAPSTDAMSMAA